MIEFNFAVCKCVSVTLLFSCMNNDATQAKPNQTEPHERIDFITLLLLHATPSLEQCMYIVHVHTHTNKQTNNNLKMVIKAIKHFLVNNNNTIIKEKQMD